MFGSDPSPFSFATTGWRHRALIWRLARREIQSRYRGSLLGVGWAVMTPLLMLAVYTFVFSVVLEPHWEVGGGRMDFALRLFLGITIFQFFASGVNVAPDLMRQNAVYIKRMVFPLDVLPYVTVLTSAFDAVVGFALLLLLYGFVEGVPPATTLLVPLVLGPLALMVLGAMWLLSALGVFLRDLGQIVRTGVTMLLFVSAVFYPVAAIPEQYRLVVVANPIAILIDVARAAMFSGEVLIWPVAGLTVAGVVFAWLGHHFFQRTRGAFADVV